MITDSQKPNIFWKSHPKQQNLFPKNVVFVITLIFINYFTAGIICPPLNGVSGNGFTP